MATFDMVVWNNTGSLLNNVLVIHVCDDAVTGIYNDSMEAGATSDPSTCTTYDLYKDYYLIQFANGGTVYQANCYCDSDSDSSKVVVQLQGSSYSIQYNDTSCNDKSYDYSTD